MFRSQTDDHQGDTIFLLTSVTKVQYYIILYLLYCAVLYLLYYISHNVPCMYSRNMQPSLQSRGPPVLPGPPVDTQ